MIDSYGKLPLGGYMRITDALNEPGTDNVQKQAAVLEVLTGIPAERLMDMPIGEYMGIVARSRFLDKDMERPEVRKRYEVGRWTLVPVSDIRRITAAQYIDFQTFSKNPGPMFAEILSCLLVPEGKRYNDGYDVAEVQQAIRDAMPVPDALAVYAFFFASLANSMEAMLISSRARVRLMRMDRVEKRKALEELRAMTERLRALRRAGAGSAGSTRSRRRAGAHGRRSGG